MFNIYERWKGFQLFLIMLFLISGTHLNSQSFPATTYTLENGLNTNFIHDVTQDKQGRMWFATEFGVSVYDGYSWRNYGEKDGLPRTEYFQIKVDSSNNIIALPFWCAQYIAVFKNEKWQLISSIPDSTGKFRNYTSFDFLYKNDKLVLYFGTSKGLLSYENNVWNLISDADGLINNQINSVKSFQNRLYVATDNGLSIIKDGKVDNRLNSVLKSHSKKINAIDFELRNNHSNPILWLLGKEWIGTIQDGKFILQNSDNRMSTISTHQRLRHTVITYDKKDRIYYGTELERFYLEKSTKKITAIGQENGFTTSGSSAIFLDREANIWFASFRGIDKVSNMSFQNYFQVNGLLENEVSSILEAKPGYMVFGHNRGLTLLKNGKFNTIRFNSLSREYYFDSRVLDLCGDSLGNVWIAGSELGVGRLLNSGKIEWIKSGNNSRFHVYSVQCDISGTIWVSANDGLYKVSEDHTRLIRVEDKVFNTDIRRIFCDSNGVIYGAKSTALAIFMNGVASEISDKSLAYGNNMYAVQDYMDNQKFLGTVDGLYLFENGSFKKFNKNGFSIDRKIFSITRDKKNNFWFGTNDGVVRWDGKEARRLSVEDGLSGRETNRSASTVDSYGRVWIGTDRGLSCYTPQYDTPVQPPRLITIEIGGYEGIFYKMDKEFSSAGSDNSYTFRLKAISFINEKFIQYRTKLEGFDDDWIEDGYNNYVRYTNLPSGNYRLVVQVKNLGSNWSKPFASGIITIEKPFYMRWWFIVSAISVIAFIFFIGYTNLSQKKYNIKLEMEIKERTKALYDSENKLRTIIENAPNTITAIDGNGEILFINQSLPDDLKADSIPKNIFENISEENVNILKSILAEVLNEEKTVTYEMNYKDENGIDRWIENSISPVTSQHDISEAIIISSDVTERKLNEITRREIEERQNTILKALPLVFYNSSYNSKFAASWITENVFSCTGFEVSKFLHEENFWSSRIHNEDREFVAKEFENLLVGKSINVEYRWLCADGYYKWFLDYAVPKKMTEEGDQEFLGIWLDITDKKQLQQRLEKLNECFLNFGIDPRSNIQMLVTLCGIEMNSSFVLYNYLNNDLVKNVASWNLEEEIALFTLEGRLCSKVFTDNNKELILINNVDQTPYAKTDPSVVKLGIKTYLGAPVIFGNTTTGSLCLIYQNQKSISESDLKFISIIASAIAVEEERRASQEIIQNSLEEKEILLKEIHHRVKNNLQVISSLLYLQSEDVEDEKTLSMFKDSTSRVRSMALVHEKLYQSMDLAHINFEEYINNLVIYLFNAYSSKVDINKKIDIDNILLSVDTALPCGLIANELVSNSIKYAFPSGQVITPEIVISVRKKEEQIELIVSDNGIGLPDNINFDSEQKSLGLKLVKMLTDQLNGTIHIERRNGTHFRITFNNPV